MRCGDFVLGPGHVVIVTRDVTAEDIAVALAAYDEVIDVSPEDLLAVIRAAEAAADKRLGRA